MKGILIEPGKAPVVTALPDTLQGIEAMLGGPPMQYTFSRTPAMLIYSYTRQEPNRYCHDRMVCGPILCYGWKNNSLVPMGKGLQAEMLDRLKETDVRV